MRPIRFRLTLLVLFCGTCVGLADDPSPAAKKLAQKLTAEQKAFDAAQKKAKAGLVTALRAAETAAVQNDPTALGRDKQKTIKAEREAFEKAGTLPTSDDALDGVFAYLTALHQARPKLRQAHQSLVVQLGKDGNAAGEAKAKADLAAFDATVQGVREFKPGTRWVGVLRKPRNTTNMTFNVREVTDELVRGRVSLDNNWLQMDMEGLRDGPYFDLKFKSPVIGNQPGVRYVGFVLGDRLVLQMTGLVNKNKVPVSGVAVLTRAAGR